MTPTLDVLRRMASAARTPRLRSMRQFAEAEIIIPDGPFAGRKFKADRQPFTRLWFDAIESDRWRRFVATGPTQSGKTLACNVIPLMYHLFEVGETVILGLPSLDMAADKWLEDIRPAIAASRYRDLLPLHGAGSRGGTVRRIQFAHGPTLRFMSGGGGGRRGDKARAGFTSRVLCITETDGMDEAAGGSEEASKIDQLEARTRAYGDRARIYMECTVSTSQGRTWREYQAGTASRIATRCPHCGHWVSLEREHLVGWADAPDVLTAGEESRFGCPECGAVWSEEDRAGANRTAVLVHKGQELTPEGTATGALPRTDTLGFRWSAANNLLIKDGASVFGKDEWKAARDPDEENAEKHMRQFVWALPYDPQKLQATEIDAGEICRRTTQDPKGRLPSDAAIVTVGIDCGKRLLHWLALAWRPNATPHVIDYGRQEVAIDAMTEERALLSALRELRDSLVAGWASDNGPVPPASVLVDSGWHDEVVHAACVEAGPAWLASKGFGSTQGGRYREARRTGVGVAAIGEHYHVARLPGRLRLLELDADIWKSRLHARMTAPVGQVGALTLFKVQKPVEHLSLAKHLTAEKQVQEFVPGRGEVTRWQAVHANNHWLDAGVLALVAGHWAGARLIESTVAPRRQTQQQSSWFANQVKRQMNRGQTSTGRIARTAGATT